MSNYQKIIFLTYFLLSFQLLISNNLFNVISIFFILNYYFLFKGKRTQNNINKITFIQIIGWLINSYIVLLNDNSLWFLALCNLIWLLTSIKIIEVRNLFHIKNVVIFMFISIGTSSLFSQDYYSNVIHIICSFLLFSSLLILNNYGENIFSKQLLILISFIPICLITYTYIPRLKPWLNLDSNLISETGLNNTLKPGDISSLVQNEQLVGRIYFKPKLPKPESRYWRVYVLDQFENNTWKEGKLNKSINYEKVNIYKTGPVDKPINVNSEKWILEPSFIRSLPWSGKGIPKNENLRISSKGTLLLNEPLKQRMQYQNKNTTYSWRYNTPNLSDKKIGLNGNKLLSKLGQKWAKESTSTEEIISRAENFFKENKFKYSSNPGKMRKINPYDDFLFNKRLGFCEHFAGSFTLLMRAANVPSRLVVGYQGGEVLKTFQGEQPYLLIDNSYAHAWSEVWLKDKGWVRIDPTEWIAPERISNSTIINNKSKSKFIKFSRNLRLGLYDNFSKIEFGINNLFNKIKFQLKPFIFSSNILINRFLTIVFFTISAILTVCIVLINNNSARIDVIKLLLLLYLNLLNKFNYKISPGETLNKFSKRIASDMPKISDQINKVSNLYNNYKFNIKKSYPQKISLFCSLLIMEIRVLNYILINSKK